MIRRFLAIPVIALALSTVGHVVAQQPDRAVLLLQAAQQKETVEGDLTSAIKQYETIVSTYGKTNRPVAAKALLRMASAYQRLGDAQAQNLGPYRGGVRGSGRRRRRSARAADRRGQRVQAVAKPPGLAHGDGALLERGHRDAGRPLHGGHRLAHR